jgi:putative lipoprotein
MSSVASSALSRRKRATFALVCACALVASPQARAQVADADPWFGKDKALHFGISAGIAGVMYAGAATQLDARYKSLLVAGGVTIAIGAGKELYDLSGHGDPSWRDFTWDVIGTIVGLGVAWGIDLLVRGTGDAHPPLAAPRTTTAQGVVLVF